MDRKLPLIPSIAFILSFCLAIFIYVYYMPSTLRPPISQLFVDYEENVWMLEKNHLVSIDKQYPEDAIHYTLERHNIQQHVGQIIPLRQGEFIINTAGQNLSLKHQIRRYLRLPDEEANKSALLKCDFSIDLCVPWGDNRLFFRTGWSGIELANGMIVINDTARHRVLLVSADGELLSELGDFKYPNHAIEDGDKIWIVDTNRHRIVALKIESQRLVRTDEIISLSEYEGIESRHKWPSIAYLDEQKHWWVMINDGGMAHPGIYRLNQDKTTTQYAKSVDDASYMLLDDSRLYVAVYPSNEVWVFDTQTGENKRLEQPEFQRVINEIDQHLSENKRKMWGMLGLNGLVAAFILGYAIKRSTPTTVKDTFKSHRKRAGKIDVDIQPVKINATKKIVWISLTPSFQKKLKLLKWGGVAFLLSFLLFVFMYYISQDMNERSFTDTLTRLYVFVLVGILCGLTIFISGMMDRQLGVQNNALYIRKKGSNKAVRIYGKDIFYTPNELYAKGVWLRWQSAQENFFDKASFETWAVPIIQQGQRVSDWQLSKIRLKNLDPIMLGIIGFIILSIPIIFLD